MYEYFPNSLFQEAFNCFLRKMDKAISQGNKPHELQRVPTFYLLSFGFLMSTQTSFSDCFRGCKQLSSGSKSGHGQILAIQIGVPGLEVMASPRIWLEMLNHQALSQTYLNQNLHFWFPCNLYAGQSVGGPWTIFLKDAMSSKSLYLYMC